MITSVKNKSFKLLLEDINEKWMCGQMCGVIRLNSFESALQDNYVQNMPKYVTFGQFWKTSLLSKNFSG